MTRARWFVVAAAVASVAHAVWMAGNLAGETPDEAHLHALALHASRAWVKFDLPWLFANSFTVVPNPQLVALWIGLVMVFFGGGVTVAVGALAPFHLLAAVGLWRGGRALGGNAGGVWAVGAGLGAAGTLAYAGAPLLDFPLFACAAFAAGEALSARWGPAAWALAAAAGVKLGALPVLTVFALDVLFQGRRVVLLPALFVAALYLPNAPALLDYAHASGGAAPNAAAATSVGARLAYHLSGLATLGGPALLAGVVCGLLGRGDLPTLRVLTWAGGVSVGLVPLAFFAQLRYGLPAVGLLAIAGAGAAQLGRWVLPGLGVLVAAQAIGFHTDRATWPGRPAAFTRAEGADYAVDDVLDWLMAHRPPGVRLARVAIHIAGSERLHFGVFAVRSLERQLPLEFVVVDDHRPLAEPTELGVVVRFDGQPTTREGWRTQLPAPAYVDRWADGYVVGLWDRGLPEESLLATPDEAERRNHPARQSLWVYVDGHERGPLLERASSPAVVHTAAGWEALFVRDQALWRASSPDGYTFGAAAPLTDQQGPIAAFDPAVVALPDGRLRLYAAELAGADRLVDPAAHPTRIASWVGPSLDALVREPGARLEGVGLVDPNVVHTPNGWELYVTEARRYVVRATSSDGLEFLPEPGFAHHGTVPEVLAGGNALLYQRQVMGWSVFEVAPRSGSEFSPAWSLDLCGTGAALVEDRLYYTRGDDDCPVSVADPARRDELVGLPDLPVIGYATPPW